MPPFRLFLLCLFSCLLPLTGGLAIAQSAPATGYSGLPVPRFVNLKANETWGRIGPSFDYPVRFVYRRRGLPVRVIAETRDDNWRKIADPEGATMWIHRSQLVSSSHVLVNREGGALLLAHPRAGARPRVRLQQGVLAKLETCQQNWCQIQVDQFRGWVPQSTLWGVN